MNVYMVKEHHLRAKTLKRTNENYPFTQQYYRYQLVPRACLSTIGAVETKDLRETIRTTKRLPLVAGSLVRSGPINYALHLKPCPRLPRSSIAAFRGFINFKVRVPPRAPRFLEARGKYCLIRHLFRHCYTSSS
jgi:hypothetical protein